MVEKSSSGRKDILKNDELYSILYILGKARKDEIDLNQSKLQYIFNIGNKRDKAKKENKDSVAFISEDQGENRQYIIHEGKTKRKGEKYGNSESKKVKTESGKYKEEHELLENYRKKIKAKFGKDVLDKISNKSQRSFYNKIQKLEEHNLIKRKKDDKYPTIRITQKSEELLVKGQHIDRLNLLGPDQVKRADPYWTVYNFPDRDDGGVINEVKKNTENLLKEFEEGYFNQLEKIEGQLIDEIRQIYEKRKESLDNKDIKIFLDKHDDVIFNGIMNNLWESLEWLWSGGDPDSYILPESYFEKLFYRFKSYRKEGEFNKIEKNNFEEKTRSKMKEILEDLEEFTNEEGKLASFKEEELSFKINKALTDESKELIQFEKRIINDLDQSLKNNLFDFIKLINNPMFVFTPLSYEEERELAFKKELKKI